MRKPPYKMTDFYDGEVSEFLADFTPTVQDGKLVLYKEADKHQSYVLVDEAEHETLKEENEYLKKENEYLEEHVIELEQQRADAWVERQMWKDLYLELQAYHQKEENWFFNQSQGEKPLDTGQPRVQKLNF